jgi:hypothetical protein
VPDPNYCLFVCHPLDWWSSAASWAQALLTVLTFAGTVIYQVRQNGKRASADQERSRNLEITTLKKELALSRFVAGREFRAWRRAILAHLREVYANPEEEAKGSVDTAKKITWKGDVHELHLLGELGTLLISVITVADDMLDKIEMPPAGVVPPDTDLATQNREMRELWESLVKKITRGLDSLEKHSAK